MRLLDGERTYRLNGLRRRGMHEAFAYGARLALIKLAGNIDDEAFTQFAGALRPGDVVNFSAHMGDEFERSLGDGLKDVMYGATARAVTGSPQNHSAIYAGTDPSTGEHMIYHTLDKLKYHRLRDYGDRNSLTGLRPHGVDDETAAKVVDVFRQRMAQGGDTHYPTRNALVSSLPAIADRVEGRTPRLARRLRRFGAGLAGPTCDPGQMICSAMPVAGYSAAMGQEAAVQALAGRQLPADELEVSVLPKTLGKNLQTVSTYHPANSAGGGVAGMVRGVGRNVRKLFSR